MGAAKERRGILMKRIVLAASLLALVAAPAYAQQPGGMSGSAASEQAAPGRYVVYFAFARATLDADARRVVSQAAEEYRRTGSAQISVVGHTDTVGSEAYNLDLSQRRAEAVQQELVALGVPAERIVTSGRGMSDLAVPTGPGVREASNRRVEIDFAQAAPAPAPAPEAEPGVAAEPTPPIEEVPREPRFTFALGGLYGHNFGETDADTENDLAGVELTFDALPGGIGKLSFKQAILKSFNGVNNGLVGRSVFGLGLMPLNLAIFQPFLSANVGGVYGAGVQDGFVLGPELGFNINITRNVALRAKAAYDYQLRNPSDLDEGILWGGVDLGYRF
jgi:hypothetical protein